jgi:hypothetical protein
MASPNVTFTAIPVKFINGRPRYLAVLRQRNGIEARTLWHLGEVRVCVISRARSSVPLGARTVAAGGLNDLNLWCVGESLLRSSYFLHSKNFLPIFTNVSCRMSKASQDSRDLIVLQRPCIELRCEPN